MSRHKLQPLNLEGGERISPNSSAYTKSGKNQTKHQSKFQLLKKTATLDLAYTKKVEMDLGSEINNNLIKSPHRMYKSKHYPKRIDNL